MTKPYVAHRSTENTWLILDSHNPKLTIITGLRAHDWTMNNKYMKLQGKKNTICLKVVKIHKNTGEVDLGNVKPN